MSDEVLTTFQTVLAVEPAALKWPAAVLVALCFGLVLYGLVQYQAFNRDWGLHLVLGLAGGAVVVGLGASFHWFLGVVFGLGYVLTWLVWVLTRRWSWWRRALTRGVVAALTLGPWLWLGATEKMTLPDGALELVMWLLVPTSLMWFWMLLGAGWLLVLVGGWGCWRWPLPAPCPTQQAGLARPWRRRWVAVAWAVLGILGLNWYAAGRVNLLTACWKGQHWRLGYVLVSRPGSQWYRHVSGWTPLHAAAANGNAKAFRILLAAAADFHARTDDGRTPLHEAARFGQTGAMRLLLDAGADVNAKNDDGETPLHGAVVNGNAETIRPLLDAGADVNAKSKTGLTPLFQAAAYCSAWALPLLLDAGALVNERLGTYDRTAMDAADNDECRQLLRQAGGKTGEELDAEKAKPAQEPVKPSEPGR